MKTLQRTGQTLRGLWQERRSFFWQLIGLLVLSLGALITTLTFVHPQQLRIVSHYSDFGETHYYHDAFWSYPLVFPVLALLIGLLHPLIILRLVRSKEIAVARALIFVSYALLIALIIIAARLASVNVEFI